jgi:hypothetical protein
LFQARLQTKWEMVACWLVDISPLFLVLVLEGRMASADSATAAEERCGFCWFHLVLNVIRRAGLS